jgi:predicted nucleic acid-binding protein
LSGRLFLPDNTVLVNFAQIGRMDLLRLIAAGRSTWCYTVSQECEKSSRVSGLEQLAEAPEIFGDPLVLETQVEHLDTQVFRAKLRKPGDGPAANLGEAESLSLIMNRKLDAVFITDDNGALGFAVAHGIQHVTTWDLLKTFVRSTRLDRSTAWQYVLTLGGDKRRYEELRDQDSFYVWLENPGSLRFVP